MFQNKKILIAIGVVLLVLVVAGILMAKTIVSTLSPVTLVYWGLWEPESVYQEVFEDFKKTHPNVTVRYQKMASINYRSRLTSALSGDGGPDIVRIHNSWLPMLRNNLAPFPATVYSSADFGSIFYPTAVKDLTVGSTVYGVPLETDNLVMFVNQDLFTAGGVTVPTTWEEFVPTVNKLTVRDADGKIKTAGAALGTASNVDHWQDILGLMMLQAGVDLNKNPNSPAAVEVTGFYTGFINPYRVWDETLDGSTLAFANGKLAVYFAPSWRYFDLKTMNPNLNMKVYPVPQLSGAKTVNYANYWAEAVSQKSKNQKEAFALLKFMSSKEEMTKLYSAESKIREFGEPYARTDLAGTLSADSVNGLVVAQAKNAESWYLAAFTNDGDTGINSKISKYYEDAINAANNRSDTKQTLETVASGVRQILESYGIN